jgi:alkylation response protein AidB-like acyl-CoA dehydrogenase
MVRTGGEGHGASPACSPTRRRPGCRRAARAQDGLHGLDHRRSTWTTPGSPADRLLGEEGRASASRCARSTAGRLGVSAIAVGLAQAALDTATAYAKEREQFGRPIIEFQGLSFLLADMATQTEAARALYLSAARRRDAGLPYGPQASMAKLFCTDTAMRVTTDAVQVLGGYGYVSDYPVERYMREAKVLQIFEGTNQIQRLVIGRSLAR